jgi:hypothetical protein
MEESREQKRCGHPSSRASWESENHVEASKGICVARDTPSKAWNSIAVVNVVVALSGGLKWSGELRKVSNLSERGQNAIAVG